MGTKNPVRKPKRLGGIRAGTEQELARFRGPADMVTTVIRTTVMAR